MKIDNDELVYSALKEIINIGGGNAATSLSTLIKKPVKMEVPILELMEYEEVYQSILADDKEVKVVIIQLHGGEGCFLFVASPADVQELSILMFHNEIVITEELADSAVKELVNILVNSFLNASMAMIGIELKATVPIMTYDLFGSVLSSVYLGQGQYNSKIIIMHNEFWSLGDKIEGSLFFIPTPDFMDKLIKQIKK